MIPLDLGEYVSIGDSGIKNVSDEMRGKREYGRIWIEIKDYVGSREEEAKGKGRVGHGGGGSSGNKARGVAQNEIMDDDIT